MEKDNAKFSRKAGDADYEDPDTAEAIVVPGHTISVDMSESDWDFILGHRHIVFARTSPVSMELSLLFLVHNDDINLHSLLPLPVSTATKACYCRELSASGSRCCSHWRWCE